MCLRAIHRSVMSFFEIIIIALALAADAFSVALVVSLKGCSSVKHILRLSSIFGFFQFFMPILGFFLYSQVHNHVEAYDHWIAFILLTIVGGKMAWEGYAHDEEEDHSLNTQDPTTGLTVITLAIATSIDALAVGSTFASLNMAILLPSIIIGLVCLAMTASGMLLSRCLLQKNTFIVKYAHGIGGLVLIAIGCKILLPELM